MKTPQEEIPSTIPMSYYVFPSHLLTYITHKLS
jgi:hypothetical protein